MTGRLRIVGVGPGDPGLLTLEARSVLAGAANVAALHPEGTSATALRIARAHLPAHARIMTFGWPRGHNDQARARFYGEVEERLAALLERGEDVVLPCLGDPLLYGSASRLAERLGRRFTVEITPGITSLQAAASALNRPLARGEEILAWVPATAAEARIEAALRFADVTVVLKLGRHLPRIRRLIARAGLADRAWLAAELGSARARLLPLARVEEEPPYMSLLLVRRREAP